MTQIAEQGRFERIITLTLDEAALAEGRRKAAKRLSKDSKIKGFRPGKAPLKIIESMVGAEEFRKEAIEDAVPPLLTAVLEEAELEPVVYPRLTDVRDQGEAVEVDVLVTLWPKLDEIPEYAGMRVTIEIPDVTDEQVEEQMERMRNQFADLEDVKREGFDGDFVLVDVTTTLDGEEFAAGSAKDMLYEIGSGAFLDGMDEALRGAGAGGIVSFSSTLPDGIGEHAGRDVTVRGLIKQVKAKRLPDLNDEWVAEVSEFETVEEMRNELREQMTAIRRRGAWERVEEEALSRLVGEMDLELPESLLDAEMESVFHRFAHRLEQQGIGFEQYMQLTGQDQEAFLGDLRSQAQLNLESRILLEAVADQEGITVEPNELEETITALAASARVDREDYRKALAEGGRELTLAGDILRRKAVDRILDLVVPVDEDGSEVKLPPRRGEAIEDHLDGDADDPADGQADETSENMADDGERHDESAPADDDGQEPAEVENE